MTRRFEHLPLHHKLTAVIVITTVTAILLASAATVAYEAYTFRRFLTSEVETTARIIGANGAAALRFDVPSDAEAVLATLAAKSHISSACFFTPAGELFAAHVAPGYEPVLPDLPLREGVTYTAAELISVQHIHHDGDFLGSVHIVASLDVFFRQLRGSIGAATLIIVTCSAVALFAALRLLNVIARPIDHLIATANRVSQSRDYSLRATKFSDDDMGSLTDEFNEMLALIEERDAELERRVAARTEALTASVDEKVVLLKEVHHRVKNNLQIVASLLSLQAGQIRDEETLQLFANSETRVRAMAAIHERLYLSDDLARIDCRDYVAALVEGLFETYQVQGDAVRLVTEIDQIQLGLDQAIPCGLILNELVANSLKYAFPDGRAGTVTIRVRRTGDELQLDVADDGVGFAVDLDVHTAPTLGLQLITSLTRQLQGRIERVDGPGTGFRITFPVHG